MRRFSEAKRTSTASLQPSWWHRYADDEGGVSRLEAIEDADSAREAIKGSRAKKFASSLKTTR